MKDVQKFALFAGPRLESVVSRGSIALVGDASHRKSCIRNPLYVYWPFLVALSGAFGKRFNFISSSCPVWLYFLGAGAGFALEDAYALVKSVGWAKSRGHQLRDALNLYDRVRSPHYQSMVSHLENVYVFHETMKSWDLGFEVSRPRRIQGVRQDS